MALVQPFSALALAPYALLMEAPDLASDCMTFSGLTWFYIVGTCLISIFLMLCMFKITERTSATTLSIIGNSRGVLIILWGALALEEWKDYTVVCQLFFQSTQIKKCFQNARTMTTRDDVS